MTCSETMRASLEPTAGTAPVALGWLLIERAGAWGRDALTMSTLDPIVGAVLADAGKAAGVKPVLVRRPGPRVRTQDGTTTAILAHAGATPWAERLVIHDDRDLASLELTVAAEGRPPGLGEALEGPLFLVCTHGKRDRCCATFGRPIVDTLLALHPDRTWEVSHIGGHRFAGNLLVLPDGLAYGNLDVASALAVAGGHLAGRLDLHHLRGRTALPRAAQAAEVFARRELGIEDLDGVTIGAVRTAERHTEVDVVVAGVAHVVEVVAEPLGARRPLSCDADVAEDPGTYRLSSLRRA